MAVVEGSLEDMVKLSLPYHFVHVIDGNRSRKSEVCTQLF